MQIRPGLSQMLFAIFFPHVVLLSSEAIKEFFLPKIAVFMTKVIKRGAVDPWGETGLPAELFCENSPTVCTDPSCSGEQSPSKMVCVKQPFAKAQCSTTNPAPLQCLSAAPELEDTTRQFNYSLNTLSKASLVSLQMFWLSPDPVLGRFLKEESTGLSVLLGFSLNPIQGIPGFPTCNVTEISVGWVS